MTKPDALSQEFANIQDFMVLINVNICLKDSTTSYGHSVDKTEWWGEKINYFIILKPSY